MPMELLRKLANTELPLTIADRLQIDSLRMLDALGYIRAFIPPVHVDCDDCARQDAATVTEITAYGRKALNQAIVDESESAGPYQPERSQSGGQRVLIGQWEVVKRRLKGRVRPTTMPR